MRKERLAQWLHRVHAIDADPDSLFDVQIKRIHEYKRQLLNVLHVLALFERIAHGEGDDVRRTVIFAGKAAPSYVIAKRIIRLIHETAALVRSTPRVAERLNVVFVPNYDVSSAELLFPATDLSEQISTAGTEASGTGCMKAVLNGGVIIGTHDGANIEILDEVGEENIFLFGLKAEEIEAMRPSYAPGAFIGRELRNVLNRLTSWHYDDLVNLLTSGDRYFHCADFAAYAETQQRAGDAWMRADEWSRRSILNTARSGRFSADRTVAEYAQDIWGAKAMPIVLQGAHHDRH
jgi:starch phosphorylase